MAVLNEGDIANFKNEVALKYIKQLGSGGTGDVHLFYDEVSDKYYAVKKFCPYEGSDKDDLFNRFIEEIKILVNVHHKNIVRIYFYFLYPTIKSGYILMEYIEGDSIDKYLESNPNRFDELFKSAIDTFSYLSDKHILHRDIRPANFIVKDNQLILIDFGFSKKLKGTAEDKNSVVLNWPVTNLPEELLLNDDYDEQTEIYYLGNLFKHLSNNKKSDYSNVIEKMSQVSRSERYSSFEEINNAINDVYFSAINFTDDEKNKYKYFADSLFKCISHFNGVPPKFYGLDEVLQNLKNVIVDNALEDYIQNNNRIINSFVSGNYTYVTTNNVFTVKCVKDFYELLSKATIQNQKVILSNIKNRFSRLRIEKEELLDLPF